MYRNAYQRGMLTVFFSVGSKPLSIWETHMQDGYISRFLDQDIKSMVLEIGGANVSTTYITCPKGNMVLGITMPFLVMIVKNLKKYFSFEVTILDETGTRRRFRVSNFQSSTQILPLCTVMPIGLSDGWNQIQFNLAEFTRRAYKKQFVEVQKLKINANIRLRRIYFTERLIPEDQLPPSYKLYFPISSKGAKDKQGKQAIGKENVKPSTSEQPHVETLDIQKSKSDLQKSSKTSIHSLKKVPSGEFRKASKTKIDAAEKEAVGTVEESATQDQSSEKTIVEKEDSKEKAQEEIKTEPELEEEKSHKSAEGQESQEPPQPQEPPESQEPPQSQEPPEFQEPQEFQGPEEPVEKDAAAAE